MIVYDDNERLMSVDSVFHLTLRMNIYNKNPNDDKNNEKLKRFIAKFINSLEENDQYLLYTAHVYLRQKPEHCYKITDIKKVYDNL